MDSEHLSLDELISLRDGLPRHRARHAERCEPCGRRARRLQEGLETFRDVDTQERPAPPMDLAQAVVDAAEHDDVTRIPELLDQVDETEFAQTLVAAAQLGARLVARKPLLGLQLADAIHDVAGATMGRRHFLRPLVLLEVLLLKSQGRLRTGDAVDAERLARRALWLAAAYEAPALTTGRAEYFRGSALTELGRQREALAAIHAAADLFELCGQDHWLGRAYGVVSTILWNRRPSELALRFMDQSLERLDQELDAHTVAAILGNRAALLMELGRLAEARSASSLALKAALRIDAPALIITARVNLLSLATLEGRFGEVIEKAPRTIAAAMHAAQLDQVKHGRLYFAEALAEVGRCEEARAIALDVDEEGKVLEQEDRELLAYLRQLRIRMTGTGRTA